MKVEIKDLILECVQGDITEQNGFDAIVNAANAYLVPGGGVAGAIHKKAGPDLYQECKNLAPIEVGEAVITKGYNLPNPYVIHTLGPIYNRDPKEKLAECYKNCLKLAEEYKLSSIAFCAISTGAFGFPLAEGLRIGLEAIGKIINQLKSLRRIRLVLYDRKSAELANKILRELFLEPGEKDEQQV